MYFLKIHHCSFKVSPIHILRYFGATLPVSCSSLSVSLVFHKSFLLQVFFTISSSALPGELCSGNSSLAANCSSIHYEISCSVTAEILSNNFPYISTFPCVRLKIIAMTYIRVIPNTVELLFKYLALLHQYHSVISFWQVFSAFLLDVRVAFHLIHHTFDVSTNQEK